MILEILIYLTTASYALAEGEWFSALEKPENIPYTSVNGISRESMLLEMSSKYSMSTAACKKTPYLPSDMLAYLPSSENAGLLGGILLNTHRQKETHRNELSIWNIANSSLTVEPYAFMKDYEDNTLCKDSRFIKKMGNTIAKHEQHSVDRVAVCEAWHNYFKLTKTNKNQSIVQKALWKAHSLSLFHVWLTRRRDFQTALSSKLVPPEEFRLWMSWNKTVSTILPRSNYNSCASSMWPYLEQAMPSCILGKKTLCAQNLAQSSQWSAVFGKTLLKPLLRLLKDENIDSAVKAISYEVPASQ